MNRLLARVLAVLTLAAAFHGVASAAEMTFQLINNTDRAVNLRLFSKSDSHQQWPSKTKAYSLRPENAVQQLKITCEEGEQICWGAWMTVQSVSGPITGQDGQRATHTNRYSGGVGERGAKSCDHCCHICKDGTLTPPRQLDDPNPGAK